MPAFYRDPRDERGIEAAFIRVSSHAGTAFTSPEQSSTAARRAAARWGAPLMALVSAGIVHLPPGLGPTTVRETGALL